MSLLYIRIWSKNKNIGVISDKLKISKIIPIFKNGSISDLNNYRPISKGITMRAIFSNPAGWKFIDSNGW